MRLLTNMLAIVYFYQVEETDEESINLPFIVINSLDPYSHAHLLVIIILIKILLFKLM